MQVRVNKGGRPPTLKRVWYSEHGRFEGTASQAMDLMATTGATVYAPIYRSKLRTDRATISAAARRRGMKVTTRFRPSGDVAGILRIDEVTT